MEMTSIQGLWNCCPYVNHTGIPNSKVYFMGDNFDLHAVRNIEPGEEITLSYKPIWPETLKGKEAFWKPCGFNYTCRICALKSNISERILQKRLQFINQWKQNHEHFGEHTKACQAPQLANPEWDNATQELRDLVQFVADLEATYLINQYEASAKLMAVVQSLPYLKIKQSLALNDLGFVPRNPRTSITEICLIYSQMSAVAYR
ncbi:uncharacterized protein BDR25DRAFT_349569 [Lindgomyces ingoldianus]|uniref:Uncharacterized protein n=1 Tax=Lindgomyces ingoldianus TaxID=673940 RepID=A0ACB6RDS6_9PLEO|nr:uncharacterized protein BDR25DRAFT_349569 [Lindgomyces ingoldianus]KAF2476482.1 hypothetical protein BDR25DRAFT_349569 [Lindgomyces ingoldianus]